MAGSREESQETMSARLGIMVQPHRTGLGVQQWEFARHMAPSKVLITDLSKLHAANSRNEKVVTNTDWFNGYDRLTVDGIPNEAACRWLLEGIDVLFVVETPLNWDIFKWAREMGVKTVLQQNPEFLEYFMRPVPKPDLFLSPTKWMSKQVERVGVPTIYLPVPIATDRINRREITKANHFIHISGHKAYMDRNGTEIVKGARGHLRMSNITIYDQSMREVPDYWDLFARGDILILPRRYGGLSLQYQEATAAGMPVIITDRDIYANESPSIPILGHDRKQLQLKVVVDSWSASPYELAKKIDELMKKQSIEELSERSYQWSQKRAWSVLKYEYQRVFDELVS